MERFDWHIEEGIYGKYSGICTAIIDGISYGTRVGTGF
jgi:hypothetical protein